ncbi:hypothetical protein [Kribbella swartbergensis]
MSPLDPEKAARVALGLYQVAVAGLGPYVASIGHPLLVVLGEAVNDDLLFCQLDRTCRWAIRFPGKRERRRPLNVLVDGEGRYCAPPFKAAVCGKELAEQPAHG